MKTEINTSQKEQELLCFLKTKIHTCTFKNTLFLEDKSIEISINKERDYKNSVLKNTETNTLYNFIDNTDNKIITNVLLKFLDVSKSDKIHILKIPIALRESKYKIYFWLLFFCHKNQEEFQFGFHKLIAEISKEYSKKTVFDMLNFGVTLAKIKAEKKELFTPPISKNNTNKKKVVTNF